MAIRNWRVFWTRKFQMSPAHDRSSVCLARSRYTRIEWEATYLFAILGAWNQHFIKNSGRTLLKLSYYLSMWLIETKRGTMTKLDPDCSVTASNYFSLARVRNHTFRLFFATWNWVLPFFACPPALVSEQSKLYLRQGNWPSHIDHGSRGSN